MIGTLLEDIEAGLSFEEVKRRFGAKTHPLQYQRPTAAPAAGNIAQAEKIVAQLGIEPALHRRFARLDEIQAIWRQPQTPPRDETSGVFAHLQPKGAVPLLPLDVPAQTITWEKFARTVLPTAQKIEVHVLGLMNFCALLTATNEDAPPILQWDRPEQRNPFSWYVYNGGSRPEQWGLPSSSWVNVPAVTLQPSMWFDNEQSAHQGKSTLFILEGARDTRQSGLALFPEILRSDLHAIRATVEAYSASRQLDGADEASANGLRIGDGNAPHRIRVTSPTGVMQYRIDRWD
jgi:hypothetical protein